MLANKISIQICYDALIIGDLLIYLQRDSNWYEVNFIQPLLLQS